MYICVVVVVEDPPPTTTTPTPLAWHENVMDGWGARPLRWLSVLVSFFFLAKRLHNPQFILPTSFSWILSPAIVAFSFFCARLPTPHAAVCFPKIQVETIQYSCTGLTGRTYWVGEPFAIAFGLCHCTGSIFAVLYLFCLFVRTTKIKFLLSCPQHQASRPQGQWFGTWTIQPSDKILSKNLENLALCGSQSRWPMPLLWRIGNRTHNFQVLFLFALWTRARWLCFGRRIWHCPSLCWSASDTWWRILAFRACALRAVITYYEIPDNTRPDRPIYFLSRQWQRLLLSFFHSVCCIGNFFVLYV